MLWFLCAAFAVPFSAFHLAMIVGLLLEAAREKRFARGGDAFVSLVIPVRNEAARIRPLFDSLRAVDYGNLEILFVDDRSSDDTARLVTDFAASEKEGRVRLLSLTENPGPNFKQYALGRGIDASKGELILFTDADCSFSPGWVAAMAAALSDPRTGLAIGPVFKPVTGPRFVDFFQAFDHAVRYVYLAASAGLGFPSGGFGNNLIVRRAALEALGGYDSVPFSPTEDAALIGRLRSLTAYRVRGLLSDASRVFTAPETSFRELARQGLRWNDGGLFAPDIPTRIGFNYLMLVITLGSAALPFLPFLPSLWPLSAAAYLAILVDGVSAGALGRGVFPGPYSRRLPHFLLMPPYFGLLTVLGYLGVEISWKGATIAKT